VTTRSFLRISVMKSVRLLVGLCLALAGVACGGASGDSTANGAGAPAAAGSSGSSGSGSRVVPHEKLAELLPNIPGFTRESEVKGTTDTDENVSRVQLEYIQDGGGTAGLSVEMMDVAANAVMLAPIKELLKVQGTRRTVADTEEKVTTVAGYPAAQEWTPQANNGSVSVLVADRFVIKVTGSSVANVDVISKAVEAIDLKKIAALK
jgi:hypothetical protein